MPVSLERLARNQAIFREVNERIEEVATGELADGDAPIRFVCECSDTDCTAILDLAREEYERVRSEPTWFVIESGHEIPEIERVVGQHDGFAIVQKINGEDYSKQTDPRSSART
jgi:hypothetical protein